MIDLTNYAGVYRDGRFIKFGNILNKKEFPTVEEAEKFERLYNVLAVNALKEMISIIKKRGVVRTTDNQPLSEKDLASYAQHYYQGGGIEGSIRGPTLEEVLTKTNEIYILSKDIKILESVGLI